MAILAAYPIAALVAWISLVGILVPATYGRETPAWAAQAVGQDWVDLLLLVPWLTTTGTFSLRGSRRALFLLTGGMLYTLYELVIYAFALHFNALFLVYCATLGLVFFALAGLAVRFVTEDVRAWYSGTPRVRAAALVLAGTGVLFGLGWLSEIIPALIHGAMPRSIAEAGLVTNPVYVLDLSVILPAHVLVGVSLLRRRRLGFSLAATLLTFGVLMALSIAGMLLVMRERGVDGSLGVAAGMLLFAALDAWVLTRFLGAFRPNQRRAALQYDVLDALYGASLMLFNFFTPFLRSTRSHAGLSLSEAARCFPGDDRIPEPRWSWTHAIEIDAEPSEVFPWLVQMGQDKAGFYSYELLENLVGCQIRNADEIRVEWQRLQVDDSLRLAPSAPPLIVEAVVPDSHILSVSNLDVSTGGRASWLFLLEPLPGGRCRFISRYRVGYGRSLRARLMFGPLLIEPIGSVMDCAMLRGVKRRAEARQDSRSLDSSRLGSAGIAATRTDCV